MSRPTGAEFYVSAFRHGWWLVAVAVAVAIAAALVATAQETPTFEASATLAVIPSSELRDPTDMLRGLETLERRTVVATLAKLPGRAETKQRVAQRLGVEVKELRAYWIGGSVVPNTNLVRIEVHGPEPRRAAEVANAAARIVRREGRSLFRIFTLREVAAAETPRRPARPQPWRNAFVAALLGSFVGVLAALARASLRRGEAAG